MDPRADWYTMARFEAVVAVNGMDIKVGESLLVDFYTRP